MPHHATRVARNTLVATALIAVGLAAFTSAAAFGAGTIHVNVASGLGQGQVVTVTGTGLAASSYGYVLECNETPGEPTVTVGPPFDQSIPIGCSPPSLKHLVGTSSTGTLSTTFQVHESRRLGPPCNPSSVFGPCFSYDSARKKPRADAQNYPCPPSPAQQTAGVKCALVFYDAAHEKVSTPIVFQGGGPTIKTPGTPGGGQTPGGGTTPGGGKTTTTTAPKTTTTAPKTTSTTHPATPTGYTAPTAPRPAIAVRTGAGDPAGAPSAVRAGSGSLAFTGLGTGGKIVAGAGAVLVLVGLALLFVNLRRLAYWLLGL
ncbi:MAG TPA: hypothetical protein VLZ77_03420 [Acidimicrobiales bacterium]|nr:hypothetical protein [Acidimicrobiales bacterium]